MHQEKKESKIKMVNRTKFQRHQTLTELVGSALLTETCKDPRGPIIEATHRQLGSDDIEYYPKDFSLDYELKVELRFREPVPISDVARELCDYAKRNIGGYFRPRKTGERSYSLLRPETKSGYLNIAGERSKKAAYITISGNYGLLLQALFSYLEDLGLKADDKAKETKGKITKKFVRKDKKEPIQLGLLEK